MVFSKVNPAKVCKDICMQQEIRSRMKQSILSARELRASHNVNTYKAIKVSQSPHEVETPGSFYMCVCMYMQYVYVWSAYNFIFFSKVVDCTLNCGNNNSSWVNVFQISLRLGITFKKCEVRKICGTVCSFDPDSLIKTILLLLFSQRFAIL